MSLPGIGILRENDSRRSTGGEAPAVHRGEGLAPRRFAWLGIAVGVVLGHAALLLNLSIGVGPATRANGGIQPLQTRQIVAVPSEPVHSDVAPEPAPRSATRVAERMRTAAPHRPSTEPERSVMPASPIEAEARPSAADAEPSPRPVATLESGGEPIPVYPTRLPPPAQLRYELRRGLAIGNAELQWQPSDGRYTLGLRGVIAGTEVIGWASRGTIDGAGIAPERFVVRRRGRELHAANFKRDTMRVAFSGPSFELPLVAGTQDRVSWMLQLAAILEAAPASLRKPDQHVSMLVIGARGDAEIWTFTVAAIESIDVPVGRIEEALLLKREPRRPYDTQVDIWLDPARSHLPVRVRFAVRPSGESTELDLAALNLN